MLNQQRSISVMAFPRRGDAYIDCFYAAVEAQGVEVQEGQFSGRWLGKHLRNIDYVHIHWPSFFYSYPEPRKCIRHFALFLFFLGLTRWRGAQVIWTIHNLYPHDRCIIPGLDKFTRWLLVRWATIFFVHGSSAQKVVVKEFPNLRGLTVLIEHGHWIGYYPNQMSASAARSRLQFAENEFVFLFIGLCKPYKNLERLISAFDSLPGTPKLIIAGKFQDVRYEAHIRAALDSVRNDRIILRPGFVSHDEMQIYVKACSVVVTPYSDVLTSGSAMLALSFGRPVIAPAIGSLKDLIVEGCGLLYDPSRPNNLGDAMLAAANTKFNEQHILAEAAKRNWGESAKIVVDSLRRHLHRDGESQK